MDTARNLLVTGKCGVGKPWLSCALAQKACRDGYTVYYARAPRLFADLELAHGDGRFVRLFRMLTGVDLLLLDDWGQSPWFSKQAGGSSDRTTASSKAKAQGDNEPSPVTKKIATSSPTGQMVAGALKDQFRICHRRQADRRRWVPLSRPPTPIG